ncbi:LLM class flavin-dependent oxidoreductase [Streptomyces sp. NBC_00638]|uniref:LLM class flavin-dependent oxidoreductase n=1 Tax=Streptomyces sp. NBC_00638 TaxID=2975794 RepID=UPI002252E67A|nr:LLM class flavin-dependent oxidoreductase [Streptomyces sp. NBC_00638]MCX5009054.1 LLM class flavin-dependent oxidoreductase [Streptomyces sp. NBC_00638]
MSAPRTLPRIGYAPWGETLEELVAAGRAAREAGADTLWAGELHRSATITAAALAPVAGPARIGTAVALAFVRSPLTTALEALDLDELSAGRFVLGLGSGVRRLNEDWHRAGFDPPVRRLRETVACVRAFTAECADGGTIEAGGDVTGLRIRGYRRPFPPMRPRIPVHLAAVGPAMTRLAGEIADGWIGHELGSSAHLKDTVLPGLAEGRARRAPAPAALGPDGRAAADGGLDGFEVTASACCAIDPDPRRAHRLAAGGLGFYASVRTYGPLFAEHGLEAEQQRVVEEFRGAGARADRLGHVVDPAMTRALTLTGTPDEVAERLTEYAAVADSVKLGPPVHGLDPEEIRAAQAAVIALIKKVHA